MNDLLMSLMVLFYTPYLIYWGFKISSKCDLILERMKTCNHMVTHTNMFTDKSGRKYNKTICETCGQVWKCYKPKGGRPATKQK